MQFKKLNEGYPGIGKSFKAAEEIMKALNADSYGYFDCVAYCENCCKCWDEHKNVEHENN